MHDGLNGISVNIQNGSTIQGAGIKLLDELIRLSDLYEARWHPLGFVHFKIRHDAFTAIRLHIWPRHEGRMQDPSWLIHNHDFVIDSHVLLGQIKNREYNVINEQSQPTHVVYEVTYTGELSQLIRTDNYVACSLSSDTDYVRGQNYRVPLGIFHASHVAPDDFTATLVTTSDKKSKKPQVLGPSDGGKIYTYKRSLCESRLAQEFLIELRETLASDYYTEDILS